MNFSLDERLEKHGTFFNVKASSSFMEQNQCYRNAQTMTLSDPTLTTTYCEGYLIYENMRIPHAWCLTEKGLIDLSLPQHINPSDCRYFGVKVPREFLTRTIFRLQQHAVCIELEEFWKEHEKPRS